MVLVLVDLWLPTYIWHILSVDVVSTILLLNYRRPIDPERTTSEKQFVYVALQEKWSTHATWLCIVVIICWCLVFPNMLYFHPEDWGRISLWWTSSAQRGGSTTTMNFPFLLRFDRDSGARSANDLFSCKVWIQISWVGPVIQAQNLFRIGHHTLSNSNLKALEQTLAFHPGRGVIKFPILSNMEVTCFFQTQTSRRWRLERQELLITSKYEDFIVRAHKTRGKLGTFGKLRICRVNLDAMYRYHLPAYILYANVHVNTFRCGYQKRHLALFLSLIRRMLIQMHVRDGRSICKIVVLYLFGAFVGRSEEGLDFNHVFYPMKLLFCTPSWSWILWMLPINLLWSIARSGRTNLYCSEIG